MGRLVLVFSTFAKTVSRHNGRRNESDGACQRQLVLDLR